MHKLKCMFRTSKHILNYGYCSKSFHRLGSLLLQWRSRHDNWGGEAYSYIRVHRPSKQSISNEINCAVHKYMNLCPFHNYRVCYATVLLQALSLKNRSGNNTSMRYRQV